MDCAKKMLARLVKKYEKNREFQHVYLKVC
jgi:hypothetical protein